MQNRARIFVLDRLSEKTDRDVNEPDFVNCRLSTTGIDSLDVMELLTEIEDEFDVRFEDTTVTAETTVQQVIDFIVTKTG
ncbi:MAG: phosphopantetheine-binding protein [Planctomycetota bacterium]